MIDRLRAWWERPIAEHERRRAFVLAAAVILLAVAGLAVTRSTATHHATPRPAPTVSTVPAPPSSPPEPSGPPRTDPPGAGVPPDLGPIARRFLEGYLAYLYGRGPARSIPHAAPALLGRLERNRPRISRRHASVTRTRSR